MPKMCPRCGVVFEVQSDTVFCSGRCRTLFQTSGLDMLKGGHSGGYLNSIAGSRAHNSFAGDEHTEITRPRREKK